MNNNKADRISIISIAFILTLLVLFLMVAPILHPFSLVVILCSVYVIGDIIIAYMSLKKETEMNER